MNYQDLREQTLAKPAAELDDYKKLFSYACVGGKVKERMVEHLENAADIDEFYAMVYADDRCKYENAWGYYAKIKNLDFTSRFTPDTVRRGIRLQLRGIAVDCKEMQFFIPMTGRNRYGDFFVYADGNFNEETVDYFTSVSGTFTILDMEFAGTYDIFVGPRLIVLERWEFDKLGNRLNGKGETKMCCSCR